MPWQSAQNILFPRVAKMVTPVSPACIWRNGHLISFNNIQLCFKKLRRDLSESSNGSRVKLRQKINLRIFPKLRTSLNPKQKSTCQTKKNPQKRPTRTSVSSTASEETARFSDYYVYCFSNASHLPYQKSSRLAWDH